MYARIFTCTPGDLDTQPGMEAQLILDKTATWTERVYDMAEDEVEKYFEALGVDCNKIFYIEYSYTQLGKTEAWLQAMSAKIGNPLVVRREILLQRLHGSSASPFPQEDIEYIVSSEKKPIDELWLLDYYKFDIYTKLNPRVPYLVGVDCSTGTGGDNNAITIIDPYKVEPVAEFESSYIGETMYERLLKEICKVLPRCVLIIERNSIGDGIIDHLYHSEILPRLYFDKSLDLVKDKLTSNETIESMLKKNTTMKSYYGVYTSNQSRDDMMAILARHVNEYKEKFVTHNVIRDLSRLVRKSSGRVEAGPSFHDDSIMSYLIALYVFYHGNNLQTFGISRAAKDEDLNNSGIHVPEPENYNLVDDILVEELRERKEKEKASEDILNWDDMMADAIKKAQQDTYKLHQNKLIDNSILQNSDYVDDDNSFDIPLDFFNEINGM